MRHAQAASGRQLAERRCNAEVEEQWGEVADKSLD